MKPQIRNPKSEIPSPKSLSSSDLGFSSFGFQLPVPAPRLVAWGTAASAASLAVLAFPDAWLVLVARSALALVLPPTTCKFHPSCSQYARDAIVEHGVVRGFVLAGWRLLRCHPWSHGGVDYP